MVDNVLYIIGNGFDRHHGIESSYTHFRDWLHDNNRQLYDIYSHVCRYDALWSDFENGMAYVDRDYFIDGAGLVLPDSSKDLDDCQMSDILMAEDFARGQANALIINLKEAFFKWIKSLQPSKSYDSKKIMIDYDARFLTFNYTEFLETEYGINPVQINYIHGHRKSGRNSIIVGHGGDDVAFDKWWQSKRYTKPRYNRKGKKYYRRDNAYKVYQSDLPEYNGIAEGLQEYYNESRKPVELILSNNRDYFYDLYDIKVIYVLGFSFNPIDLPYIKAIIRANDYPDDIEWRVSYYGDDELNMLKLTLKDLGVDVEHKVKFFLLSKIQL